MTQTTARRTVEIVPAVDVLGEGAVRLREGDFGRVTLRAGSPAGLVRRFARAGAPLIHLVDLDGARSGRLRPALVAEAVAAAGGVPVQASGGVRSVADAEALLQAGAARVVVGTAAFDGDTLPALVDALGERLVVALDVRGDRAQVAGWRRSAGVTAEGAVERVAAAGVTSLLCTAVERDGARSGPDLVLVERVRRRFGGRLLAAGGIGSAADLEALGALGVDAAVVGSALLDGRLPLSLLAA